MLWNRGFRWRLDKIEVDSRVHHPVYPTIHKSNFAPKNHRQVNSCYSDAKVVTSDFAFHLILTQRTGDNSEFGAETSSFAMKLKTQYHAQ